MTAEHVLFDAVVFDLDGTLAATERYWVAAAARGAQRAFEELGLERAPPSAAEWMAMVGSPLEQAFERVFSDLTKQQRARVMALCVEEEHAALAAGGAAPMPGAFEVLRELRARGVKIAIASNCSAQYLEALLDGLSDGGDSLRSFVDQARCLQSPRVRDKGDMIRDLLESFGTRSAVMVGDRSSDAEAAHANALAHIHVASGFASADERVECEATLQGLDQLLAALGSRARWIGAALERVDARTLGVSGRPASGKSLFARDAARVLSARGVAARVISLDAFLRESPNERAASDDHLERAFDLDSLLRSVLEPRRLGRATLAGPWGAAVAPDERLIVEGLFLADPRLRPAFDGLIHLAAPDELLLRRALARDPSGAELVRMRRDFLPAHDAFETRLPPAREADLVLDASNSLGAPLPSRP